MRYWLFLKPEREKTGRNTDKEDFKGGLQTNPIILGILAGVIGQDVTSLSADLIKTVVNLGKLATPLDDGDGAAFDAKKASKDQTGGYCYGIETGGLVWRYFCRLL